MSDRASMGHVNITVQCAGTRKYSLSATHIPALATYSHNIQAHRIIES